MREGPYILQGRMPCWNDRKNKATDKKCIVQSGKEENWIAEGTVLELLHSLWGQNGQTNLMKQEDDVVNSL